ncbi:DUF6115 domain-containing protein [Konateibacter massiliensis]|uniref:DUF6115 domain-containing protein n=1 Tax=Konateibacter massiliensis TaxID=2002841 RepID=UPI000C14AB5D|nr:DUF6115 domain-containing protein [Konateibacter massiliensis]
MTVFEIFLVIIGLILFGGSFMVSEKITATREQLKAAIDEKELKSLLQTQIDNMNDDIVEMVNEAAEDSTVSVKRSMEKLSNEKIMAINEYSDTVMESIHKNHNEVMFLYGMLNDKNKEIKDTAELITKANKSINKKLAEAQMLTEKMESQISFLNEYRNSQEGSLERMEESTKAIELLEKQIKNIEQMALQFSKDMEETTEGYYYGTDSEKEELPEKDFVEEEDEAAESDVEDLLEGFIYREEEETKMDVSNYNYKILDMSQEGQSALEIAKTLGLGVGEVQLVIDLFKGGR